MHREIKQHHNILSAAYSHNESEWAAFDAHLTNHKTFHFQSQLHKYENNIQQLCTTVSRNTHIQHSIYISTDIHYWHRQFYHPMQEKIQSIDCLSPKLRKIPVTIQKWTYCYLMASYLQDCHINDLWQNGWSLVCWCASVIINDEPQANCK